MTRRPVRTAPPRWRQPGLSLVELLVGVAIALFVAATGATLLAASLHDSRRLLLEARLMQDLRTAADLITRDLRRSGYWGAATDGVWIAGAATVAANPYLAVAADAAASDAVSFRYSRDPVENGAVDANEQFGYRLRRGAIEIELGAGNWQALTDVGTFTVTAFSVTPTEFELDLQSFCPTACAAGDPRCPPRQRVRSLTVAITGERTGDAMVRRRLESRIRLRNDPVAGACGV